MNPNIFAGNGPRKESEAAPKMTRLSNNPDVPGGIKSIKRESVRIK
jgi:hypothetical protein